MRLKNILFVVSDIEKSKAFYQELFALRVITDFGKNVILSEGLVLQEQKLWEDSLGKQIVFGGHDAELYFEEHDMDRFLEKLKNFSWNIHYVTECMECDGGKRIVRLYDPDRHLLEVGEAIYTRKNE